MDKFKKIAMRCNQKQFDKIKPKLEGVIKFNTVFTDFEKKYPYLTNFYGDQKMGLGWRDNLLITSEEIYEQWDEKVFLEACGIETKPNYQITKETILKYNMKDEFPDVFEVKLEVGKWYKSDIGGLWFIEEFKDNGNTQTSFGINKYGDWQDRSYTRNSEGLIEATRQEVETALKNEAVKRYKVGDYIKLFSGNFGNLKKDGIDINKVSDKKFTVNINLKYVYCGNLVLYRDGIWAEIIPTKTKKEAEELLNCKIV